jgi:hypothetical protein
MLVLGGSLVYGIFALHKIHMKVLSHVKTQNIYIVLKIMREYKALQLDYKCTCIHSNSMYFKIFLSTWLSTK